MPRGRTLVYYYNGDQSSEEVEEDFLEETTIPVTGALIERNEKSWQVQTVLPQLDLGGALPVYRVFLVERSDR